MNPIAIVPLTICVILETMQQIFYSMSERKPKKRIFFIGLGVVSYIFILVAWFWLLKLLPLGIASPLMGISYITVALASMVVFKEKVDIWHWIGILIIIIGVALVSKG